MVKPNSSDSNPETKVLYYVSTSLINVARDVVLRFGDSARILKCECIEEVNDVNLLDE